MQMRELECAFQSTTFQTPGQNETDDVQKEEKKSANENQVTITAISSILSFSST